MELRRSSRVKKETQDGDYYRKLKEKELERSRQAKSAFALREEIARICTLLGKLKIDDTIAQIENKEDEIYDELADLFSDLKVAKAKKGVRKNTRKTLKNRD